MPHDLRGPRGAGWGPGLRTGGGGGTGGVNPAPGEAAAEGPH